MNPGLITMATVAKEAAAKAALQTAKKNNLMDQLGNVSTGLFLTSMLTEPRRTKKAEQKMERDRKIDDVKYSFPHEQADLIEKLR